MRLPVEVLERLDRYAARLDAKLHLSLSRSDALRRSLTLALEDAEDAADAEDAEAILRVNEPRVSWEELMAGSAMAGQAEESRPTRSNSLAQPPRPTTTWIQCCSGGWTVTSTGSARRPAIPV